jgi:type I restriction enzyme S subunit
MAVENLITEHLDIWTSAIKTKSSAGRGSSKKLELVGVKKLRELILELAVRGKLVPQDPNDEPASELLKKIETEKARLVEEGKIKKQKILPPIEEDEKPFVLSKGWAWSRLDVIAPMSIFDGDWIESKDQDPSGSIRLVQLADIGVGEFKDKSERFINKETFKRLNCTKLEESDILIARLPNPIGRACLFPKNNSESITVVDVAILRPLGMFDPAYLVKAINSNTFYVQVNAYGKGATRFRIATGNLKTLLIPFAPLNEQHRIVAKVDELMALCDQLEAQTEASIDAHKTLVEVLLTTLTDAKDADELNDNWQTISQHFDVLFTTQASIDQLKQTILQLAVMGKLVKQDPKDEPASKLLKRIATEKQQLIKDGRIKKQKPLPLITDDEKQFELPEGWEWRRLGDVLQVISDYHANGGYKTLKDNVELLDSVDYAIMLRTTNFSVKNFDNYKYITELAYNFLDKSKLFPGDIIMNKIGDPGASFFVEDRGKPMSLAMNLFLLRAQIVDSKYVYLYLSGNYDYIRGFANGTSTQTITKEAVANLVFTLAPIEEQSRIIAKVDELMALCDALKARLIEAQTTQLNFTGAVVSNAVGQQVITSDKKVEIKTMKITTALTNGDQYINQHDGILAALIKNEGGEADAKVIWNKSSFDLPSFYKQLKKEIKAGYINPPAKADFEQ